MIIVEREKPLVPYIWIPVLPIAIAMLYAFRLPFGLTTPVVDKRLY